jgi:hypothetical protein
LFYFLEFLLVESLHFFVLAGVVVVLARVILFKGRLVLLGAVGDKVVWVSTPKASILWTTTTSVVQAVVLKP